MEDDKTIKQDLSNEVKLEIWLDECDMGEIPEGWYREDPISRPTITVKEAYDLNLLSQGAALRCDFPNETSDYPASRRVTVIDKRADRYELRCEGGYSATLHEDEDLDLSTQGLQTQLVFGAWLKARRQRIKEREDAEQTRTNLLNDLWGLVYPDEPDGWDYPAQVFRHVQDKLREQAAEIERLRNAALVETPAKPLRFKLGDEVIISNPHQDLPSFKGKHGIVKGINHNGHDYILAIDGDWLIPFNESALTPNAAPGVVDGDAGAES